MRRCDGGGPFAPCRFGREGKKEWFTQRRRGAKMLCLRLCRLLFDGCVCRSVERRRKPAAQSDIFAPLRLCVNHFLVNLRNYPPAPPPQTKTPEAGAPGVLVTKLKGPCRTVRRPLYRLVRSLIFRAGALFALPCPPQLFPEPWRLSDSDLWARSSAPLPALHPRSGSILKERCANRGDFAQWL